MWAHEGFFVTPRKPFARSAIVDLYEWTYPYTETQHNSQKRVGFQYEHKKSVHIGVYMRVGGWSHKGDYVQVVRPMPTGWVLRVK